MCSVLECQAGSTPRRGQRGGWPLLARTVVGSGHGRGFCRRDICLNLEHSRLVLHADHHVQTHWMRSRSTCSPGSMSYPQQTSDVRQDPSSRMKMLRSAIVSSVTSPSPANCTVSLFQTKPWLTQLCVGVNTKGDHGSRAPSSVVVMGVVSAAVTSA